MHPIFEKLCETLSGDVMAKAADESSGCSYCGGSGDVCMADGEWLGPCPDCVAFIQKERDEEFLRAAEKKPTTDADAELMARLLNGGEK